MCVIDTEIEKKGRKTGTISEKKGGKEKRLGDEMKKNEKVREREKEKERERVLCCET